MTCRNAQFSYLNRKQQKEEEDKNSAFFHFPGTLLYDRGVVLHPLGPIIQKARGIPKRKEVRGDGGTGRLGDASSRENCTCQLSPSPSLPVPRPYLNFSTAPAQAPFSRHPRPVAVLPFPALSRTGPANNPIRRAAPVHQANQNTSQ